MLTNILYTDHMSEDDIALEAAVEAADIKVDRMLSAYKAICEKAELDLREAELRCFQESGDMDDLTSFYMEAEEKTEEKKKGLLSNIWQAIKDLCKKIKNFFVGEKDKIDPNQTYEAPTGVMGIVTKVGNFIKGLGKGFVNFLKSHKGLSGILALTGSAGVIAILCNKDKIKELFDKKKENVKGTALIKFKDECGEICEVIHGSIENITEGDEGASEAKTILSSLKSVGTSVINYALGKGADLVDAAGDTAKGLIGTAKEKTAQLGDKKAGQKQLDDSRAGQKAIASSSQNPKSYKKSKTNPTKLFNELTKGRDPEEVKKMRNEMMSKGSKNKQLTWLASKFNVTFEYAEDDEIIGAWYLTESGENEYIDLIEESCDDLELPDGVSLESSNESEDSIFDDDLFSESSSSEMEESMNDIDHLLDDMLSL